MNLDFLKNTLDGELQTDDLHKIIYATDASVYRKIPLAVAYPKNEEDIKKLISFAIKNKITLTPRTAGTSLAGQCVTNGIVVDFSKHFTKILAFDEQNKTITVQPGVIRDELNLFLKPYNLFFSPNTSTSNRCMIGGMVGNNSSGTTSIKYGVTRDKIVKIEAILSDTSKVIFTELNQQEFKQKCFGNTLENKIYKKIKDRLSNSEIQQEIKNEFPKPEIHRRNTGYAIDSLLDFSLFGGENKTINLSKILCGSEGTLAINTAITLKLDSLPPKFNILVASHFNSINESLNAVQIAMKHNLYLCELMDKTILDCTKNNIKQLKNRFFIQGDPKAILMLEVKANSQIGVEKLAENLISDLKKHHFGYAHSKIMGNDVKKVIELRKSGLGLLGNIIGDKKGVACIEDTAVSLQDLPNYISEFTKMMATFKQDTIYYAHAGAGELHLRPILNLKKKKDVVLFREITTKTAKLVKKYQGSFSGEHGDGIVRAEFIESMIGSKNYSLLKEIKQVFDANTIFNKGKIIFDQKMDINLRYKIDRIEPNIQTKYDFSDNKGILRLAEKCNGSGDCRKPQSSGGVMCPSYRATKNEIDTTRARANMLREILTNYNTKKPFNNKSLKAVFDLCINCKACASECPSNVDVSILKSEFLYQYQKENKPSLRTKLFANTDKLMSFARISPSVFNFISNFYFTKKILGISTKRNLPKISKKTLFRILKHKKRINFNEKLKKIYLFIDEFTNNYDVQIGLDTYNLLTKLGYEVAIIEHAESGRAQISKGFLDDAKVLANKNVTIFKNLLHKNAVLVGIEPSAILTFRDEYLRLANDRAMAQKIAKYTFTIEEFIASEISQKYIQSNLFINQKKQVKIHTHCHQKALSSSDATFKMLNIIPNYKVTVLNTGCCGMAGSFGYEAEHYDISMQIGKNSVFNKIRNCTKDIEISVSGTSCRHQIFDGTNRKTKHPVSILLDALI